MLALLLATAVAAPSLLWGEQGERFDPSGRLPDVSRSGYAGADADLPEVDVSASVLDYGATGDGVTDDTAAFVRALTEMSPGALWIPPGRYALRGPLRIGRADVVLRGGGPDHTVLAFAEPLASTLGPAPRWSWNGGMLWVESPSTPVRLSAVLEPALRGERTLVVADASGIAAGALVTLHLEDEGDDLGRHLHADRADGGSCDWQRPLALAWPVRVAHVSGDVVQLAQPLRTDVRPEWSPVLHTHPSLSGVGIEHLAIAFPDDVQYAGHLEEPGYNGIFFAYGAVDSWVRDVEIQNADNGVLTDRLSKHLTVRGVRLVGRAGHHGFNVASTADSLFEDLDFDADFVHAFTLDHRSNGNVLRHAASALPWIELDHHRDAPFDNVVTAIDAAVSYVNGGSWCAGPPSGARSTFWGLDGPFDPPPWAHIDANAVGDVDADASLSSSGAWIEPVDDLFPRDLYAAQVAWRHGDPYDEPRPLALAIDAPGACRSSSGPGWLAWLALAALRRRQRFPSRSARMAV